MSDQITNEVVEKAARAIQRVTGFSTYDAIDAALAALEAALPAIRADIAAEVLAAWHLGVHDGRQAGLLRMEPKSPYDGAFYDRELADRTAQALSTAKADE